MDNALAMHCFDRLPCVLIDAAAIVALHYTTSFDLFKMAVVHLGKTCATVSISFVGALQ